MVLPQVKRRDENKPIPSSAGLAKCILRLGIGKRGTKPEVRRRGFSVSTFSLSAHISPNEAVNEQNYHFEIDSLKWSGATGGLEHAAARDS